MNPTIFSMGKMIGQVGLFCRGNRSRKRKFRLKIELVLRPARAEGLVYTKTYTHEDHYDVMSNMLECDIVVSEFEFQLPYNVPFRMIIRKGTLGSYLKGINPLIHPL